MKHAAETSRAVSVLQAFALASVVAGFPLVAALSQAIDVSSTPLSIGIRGLSALVCGLLFVISLTWAKGRARWWLLTTAVLFWVLYLIRMTNDTLIESYILTAEPSSYWLWAIGGCVVPLIGLSRARYNAADAPKYFLWCFAFVFIAAALAVPNISTFVDTDYGGYEGGRAALNALNPISLGHLGVQLLLLCIWGTFLRPAGERKLYYIALFAVGGLIGLYLALVANSRGPLVSLVAAVLFAIAASKLRGKFGLIAIMLFAAVAFVPIVGFVDQLAGTQVYDRLLGQSQFDEVNTLARIDLYASAWAQFMRFPLTGYGIEDPVFGGYPHNLIIEAFMSTGLIGGFLLLSVMALAIYVCYHILRNIPQFGWLALLVIQQVVSIQFSGTIGQATILWGLLGVLSSTSALGAVRAHQAGNGPQEGDADSDRGRRDMGRAIGDATPA